MLPIKCGHHDVEYQPEQQSLFSCHMMGKEGHSSRLIAILSSTYCTNIWSVAKKIDPRVAGQDLFKFGAKNLKDHSAEN